MRFAGELIVKAPREEVFDRLKDAPFFASCVEGVRDLKEVTPTHYTAVFETKIAYIKFKFEVAVEMTRADRPTAIEAKIEGRPHGIVGRLAAVATSSFADKDGGTAIQYAVDASLTGRLGSIGQPVLKAKAKEMERQFVKNLSSRLNTNVEESAS